MNIDEIVFFLSFTALSIIIIMMMLCPHFINSNVYAISPQFAQQEITDETLDWINMTNKQFTYQGERSTDILAVDYFSNGTILNATLWLYFPFKSVPDEYTNVNYGMLIDADFDKNTGYDGIDYQLEIGWDNNTKSWTKTLTAWSPIQEQKTLQMIPNCTGFFEHNKRFITLSMDLNSMLYPNKYKVTFYAEVKKKDDFITDFTRWVAIPPVEISTVTSPNSLILKPGENRTIELKVNSTKGFEPTVFLSTSNPSDDIKSDIKFKELPIPSYGMATTPVTIAATKDAAIRPYSLIINANSSFPSEEIIEAGQSPKHNDNHSLIPSSEKKSQNIFKQSTMMITVEQPPSAIEQFADFWKKLGDPVSFMYGVAAGLSPWIYRKLKKTGSGKEENK